MYPILIILLLQTLQVNLKMITHCKLYIMITVICKQSNKFIKKREYGGKMKYIHTCLKCILMTITYLQEKVHMII